MRVLLDSSVVIRMLVPSPNPLRAVNLIADAALRRAITVLVPRDVRREVLLQTSEKRYLSQRIHPTDAEGLLALLEETGERLPDFVGPHRPLSRDAKDDFLLGYAFSAHADYLVTDDEDLLVLDGQFPFRILRPVELLAVLREQNLA